ncbi:Signal recognition particle 19 kDa protein [Acorus gramineus]|uniref:Signal recognition particle 19 kDa protein n=1 Tax=Acorus gramineus TaxID=55184 RepID=A0AAV8ZYM2_ACOGR|nr:Signal recognition particle 19 kDa protein [Acorus gramineus]KAK1274808.1 Signal recognition particle 19 kDa protein [Acorus gramineus]
MEVDQAPNIKRWIVFYPIYINSKKTIAEGRRIGSEKGCENPTCIEIGDCLAYLKIPFAIELDKAYPRDFMQRGRVRLQLKREDGSFYNPAVASRKQLMIRVAELIPKVRAKRQESSGSSNAGTSKSASAAGSSKSEKRGRKKK